MHSYVDVEQFHGASRTNLPFIIHDGVKRHSLLISDKVVQLRRFFQHLHVMASANEIILVYCDRMDALAYTNYPNI